MTDSGQIRDRMTEALKRSSADYAEIRFEDDDSALVSFRGKEPDRMNVSSTRGGIVRACTRGGWGTVAFDALDGIEDHVRDACRCAALCGRETTQLAETPLVDIEQSASMTRDFRDVPLDEKIALANRTNALVLGSHPAIESSQVAYTEQFRTVHFASSRGSWFMQERPRAVFRISATARDGNLMQRAHDSIGSATDYHAVAALEAKANEIGTRAAALLKAPKPEGGPTTVVLNPLMAGVFIHEAFGHLSEADHLHENPRMRDLMRLDREIGVQTLNVVDDGTWPNSIGSLVCDDEGTPASRTHLIRAGRVAGHLHSRETAATMGARPTGNARAIGRHHAPIVRMTNTLIENGTDSPETLFADVNHGYYACDFFGGQTALEMFTFSSAYAYRIENGKVGEMVRDLTLSGNLFETLRAIDGMANDQRLYQGGGGCGKGGQFSLPVGLGSPHIRIRNIVAGGA